MKSYKLIELNQTYNNNGFGYKAGIRGDFSAKGVNAVFPSEELPESDSVIILNDIPFTFPSKEENVKNNFELNNQEIKIPLKKYDKIHFLCAADTGSFLEKIKIGNDAEEYEIRAGFTNWTEIEPSFSEKIAIRTHKGYSGNKELDVNLTIWHQSINISKYNLIDSIRFRDNPSVHIFSITLEHSGS
ncbi:hypothetical protein J2B92_11540 [Lysinibacillus sphaericus]|uniref:hypothetical protein n=1 Tax=Lysinibacillus sphaericus TaxID=1421 RepID=UPI0018CF6184|nr:hypothetical protein [Lysinibacillus sphaericus]MBG9754185.1 hypothetical protein [Lysinibacillus sphaericus]QTB11602.1 hypothetical protein J2B92_11540 [Lysinibacillus sphaericus]